MLLQLHILLAAEIMATIVCLSCIYGEKLRLDRKTIGVFLGLLVLLELINLHYLSGIFSVLLYVILFVYCRLAYKRSIAETVISLVLCTIMMSSMQLAGSIFTKILRIDAEYARDAVINMMSLGVFILLTFTEILHNLQKIICRRSKFIMISLGFMGLTILAVLLQAKWLNKVYMQYFLLCVPTFILLLYAILKWNAAKSEAETMKERIGEIEGNKQDYEKLLTKVRLHQHAFKNHMEAINSFRYTCKTSEKLMREQDAYCDRLRKENKYDHLLLIGNDVLTGYLCGKLQAAEDEGINIDYRVTSEVSQCHMPIYYVIEMLGILFDNAVEALNDRERKHIFFEVCEADDKYEFLVRNPFPYVPYDTIIEWFLLGKSGKGSGRGLGLYHLKCLCEEWDCDIGCRNIEIEKENWIVFALRIGKTDSM